MTLTLLLTLLAPAMADPPVEDETIEDEAAAEEAVEDEAAAPKLLNLMPKTMAFEAEVAMPASVIMAPGILPIIGLEPVNVTPFNTNIAAASMWRTGWGRALYPHQLDAPFPGVDESPINMVGQGLQAIPNKHSSFQVPDKNGE